METQETTKTPAAPPPKSIDEKLLSQRDKDAILTALKRSLVDTGDKSRIDELVEGNLDDDKYAETLQKMAERLSAERRVESAVKHPLGLAIHSMARTIWGHAKGISGTKPALEYVKAEIGGGQVEKTLNISAPETGGLLVQGDEVANFFKPLRTNSVVLSLGPITRTIVDGSLGVTGLSTDVAVTWDEEVPVQEYSSEPTWAERNRPSSHARVIIPISNATLRSSASAQVLADVEDSYTTAFATAYDTKFINGTGVSSGPKGLRAYAGTTTGSAGTTFAQIVADFKGCVSRMSQNNVPMANLGWIMAHRSKVHLMFLLDTNDFFPFKAELENGTLFGYPVGATNNVAVNEGGGTETFLLLVDFSGVLVGLGDQLEVAQSTEGSYTVNGTLVNAFEKDLTLTRVRGETLMLVAQPQFIEEVNQITWGG